MKYCIGFIQKNNVKTFFAKGFADTKKEAEKEKERLEIKDNTSYLILSEKHLLKHNFKLVS